MTDGESKGATCEHCGGMVGEDGLAILLPDEAVTEESIEETVEKPKRSFADAVAAKGGR